MRRLYILCTMLLIASIGLAGYLKFKEYGMEDTKPPVISMDDDTIEISVKDDEEKILHGVTATDNKDGDVTDSLIVDSLSEFTEDGRRFATIAAFDSSNNVSKVTKTVTYSDYTSPRFSMKQPMIFRTGVTDYFDDVSVKDCIDGNITGSIKFSDNTEIYSDEIGTYEVALQVRNSAGDTVSLPFTLEITDDTSSARVNLKKYVVYTKKNKEIDYRDLIKNVTQYGKELKVVAGSDIENDSIGRNRIKIDDSAVKYSKAGTYEVEYKVDTSIDDEDDDSEKEEEYVPIVRLIVVVGG